METKFDPKSHRFGMAYKTTNKQIGHLIDYSHSMGFYLRNLDGKHFTIPRRNALYRAPEFDLVPVSETVRKLLEILANSNPQRGQDDLATD